MGKKKEALSRKRLQLQLTDDPINNTAWLVWLEESAAFWLPSMPWCKMKFIPLDTNTQPVQFEEKRVHN